MTDAVANLFCLVALALAIIAARGAIREEGATFARSIRAVVRAARMRGRAPWAS